MKNTIRNAILWRQDISSKKKEADLSEKVHWGGVIEIIDYFDPAVWVIENPQTSKTWEFQRNHWGFEGIENLAYYSSYDKNFSKKATIFKSCIKLNLKKTNVKGNNDHMARGSYSKRSSIPPKLVRDILQQSIKFLKENYEGY